MNRSPIANRSFLHGNRKSTAGSEKLVYATLDSLALKRTRLPLQLLPADCEIEPNSTSDISEEKKARAVISNGETTPKPLAIDATETENGIYSRVLCTKKEVLDATGVDDSQYQVIGNEDTCENGKEIDSNDDYEKVEALSIADVCSSMPEPKELSILAENQLEKQSEQPASVSVSSKKKRHFAKNVFRTYFSQSRLVKRPKKKRRRKQRQDSSAGPPFGSLRTDSNDSLSSVKGKRPSRTQSAYLPISSPTNFVHIASATTPNLAASQESAFSWPALDKVVITYKEKCATLPPLNRRNEGSSLLLSGSAHTQQKAKFSKLCRSKSSAFDRGKSEVFANRSFLWGSRSKSISPATQSAERSSQTDNTADSSTEQYDDVLPTPLSLPEEYAYDDVRLAAGLPRDDDALDETYDDVVIRHPAIRKISSKANTRVPVELQSNSSSENEYSSVEEVDKENDGHPVYDDVGFPKLAEERVNSLYYSGTIAGLNSLSNKDSEWEDVDDETLISVGDTSSRNNVWKSTDSQRGTSKKKFGQASRPYKAPRQRSKRFWRGSRSFRKNAIDTGGSISDLAVSLGGGSVLIIGGKTDEHDEEGTTAKKAGKTGSELLGKKVRGLVEVRVIERREDSEVQEISCFVHEDDASDGSNYESVCSFHSEKEASSEQEVELQEKSSEKSNFEVSSRTTSDPNEVPLQLEAPMKPVPPPPREASLTESLGRRIKMLRRTWSITKGSIGRIRRRTSVDVENGCEDGKYFGLARHFRKSVVTLHSSNANSTFYLERGAVPNTVGTTSPSNFQYHLEHKPSQESVYANFNPYENSDASTRSTTPSEMILENIDHYSIFTDQEPLYQFYAAAAARFAYDSLSELGENENANEDSDGYEEVRGVVPSKATTELVKPGHRTLWSQTPQVIGSGLLQSVTSDQIKLQEAKFEILTSEASYLNSLRVLEKEFLEDPVLTEQILSPTEREKLFGSVPSALQTSEKFLADLESVWRSDPMLRALPDVLLNHAHKYSDAYVTYCSNQVTIDATLKDLRVRKGSKFTDALARIEAHPSCQSLSLHSFLMLPMQRITRLPLLADAILSKLPMEQNAEKRSWENVLSTFSHTVAECNEAARATAQEAEIEELSRKLEYPGKIAPIVLTGKSLIKSGQVVQLLSKLDGEYKLTFGRKFNKLPLFLFLLTDYLLITKRKTNTSQEEVHHIVDMCKRNLVALERAPEDGIMASAKNAMVLTLLENYCGQQMNYLLSCESNTERERWLEAVCPCEHGRIGETLYEAWDCPQVVALYSYSPCQSDELLLQPGDVINVLKKMPDGWYQGEKLLNGEQGWFPGNYTKEVASEHVRARNLKQRHRLLALNGTTHFQRSGK